MPPLLSISIIAFYLSILINLFFYFQFAKKDKHFENLASIGVLMAFIVGSFLLLNSFALKAIVSLIPLTFYGFLIDFEKTTYKLPFEILSLLLSSVAVWLTFHVSFRLLLYVFVITLLLNRIPNSTKFIVFIYAIMFIFLALIYKRIGNPNLIKTSTILAVSTGALIFVNFKKQRMKMGYSLKYSLNFFLCTLLIDLLKNV